MDEQLKTMIANLPERTGKSLEAWIAVLSASDLQKHGQIVKHLKTEHGVTHGFANLIAHQTLQANSGPDVDLVDAQYAKKPAVRPIYDAVIAAVEDLPHERIPKKTAVALKRNKQFAYLQPSTKSRLDVGIQLKGQEGTARLVAKKGGMTSHVVGVTSVEQVDAELVAWLKQAWERC